MSCNYLVNQIREFISNFLMWYFIIKANLYKTGPLKIAVHIVTYNPITVSSQIPPEQLPPGQFPLRTIPIRSIANLDNLHPDSSYSGHFPPGQLSQYDVERQLGNENIHIDFYTLSRWSSCTETHSEHIFGD